MFPTLSPQTSVQQINALKIKSPLSPISEMLLVRAHSTPISNKNVVLVQAVHHEMLVDSLPAI